MTNDQINAIADQATDSLVDLFQQFLETIPLSPTDAVLIKDEVRMKIWGAAKIGALEALKAAGLSIEGG